MIDTLRSRQPGEAESYAEQFKSVTATVKEGLAGGSAVIKTYVQNEPVRALGLALGLGALLGWLIKRR